MSDIAASEGSVMSSLASAPLTDVEHWARSTLLELVLFVVGAILVSRLVSWFGNRYTRHLDQQAEATKPLVRSEAAKHRHAVTQVVTWLVIVLVYCVAAVLVLKVLDVPLSGFVAPATVAGVALGFGAQRIVQDILAGFFIVTERQYGYGDVVRLSAIGTTGATGTVEEVTLRVTRIRSIDGEVITTPNGSIVQVTNLSRDWARAVIDVPVPVTADVNRVTDVLRSVCDDAFADEGLHQFLLDPPSVMGVESIAVDQFNVRVVARTLPGKQFDVARALRARISSALLREGVIVAPSIATEDIERTAPADA
jgi:small conductance mechanosensitive channel